MEKHKLIFNALQVSDGAVRGGAPDSEQVIDVGC